MQAVCFQRVRCPYCGEPVELALDGSGGNQTLIEDCTVCCRPIEVRLDVRAGDWYVEVRRDDD